MYRLPPSGSKTKKSQLNVSMIGQDLISKGDDDNDGDNGGGLLGGAMDTFDDVKDSAVDEINNLVGDAVDDIAHSLGIEDWYSIHVMDSCEGSFKPNATASGPSLNTTNCTNSPGCEQFTLARMIFREN